MLRYRTFRPAASTFLASATIFRMAYTKPPTRLATGMLEVARVGICRNLSGKARSGSGVEMTVRDVATK
jgi:hypothetical protein